MMKEILILILLFGLVAAALFSVLIRNLLKAAITLAAASALLAVIMFLLGAWIAAVIELSVCAGMITVVFISAISLTKPLTDEEILFEAKERRGRYIYLPFILVLVLICLIILRADNLINFNFIENVKSLPSVTPDFTTQTSVIWNSRALDILGQIIVLLSGVFGVVVLFKERTAK
jgi:NADH-quinone oxidoreductase subunit J